MKPTDPKLFFSRNDAADPRLGDWAKAGTLTTHGQVAIIGYPDDRGISLNGGRLGAAQAPTAIRQALYKMTPHLTTDTTYTLSDCGDIVLKDDLTATHQLAESVAFECMRNYERVVTLGGGHDYGYPDGEAFVRWCESQNEKPVVINIDAHLDVRPLNDTPHSGTPFYRLLSKNSGITFAEIGIQPQCNSKAHLLWLKAQNGKVFFDSDVRHADFVTQLSNWLTPFHGRPCFLSVDIDAFSSAIAPGCSQSWATGLNINEFFPILALLKSTLRPKALGIYEVSPPLDFDNQTAKLAALIIHRWLLE
jgi:formiminoglutamase